MNPDVLYTNKLKNIISIFFFKNIVRILFKKIIEILFIKDLFFYIFINICQDRGLENSTGKKI